MQTHIYNVMFILFSILAGTTTIILFLQSIIALGVTVLSCVTLVTTAPPTQLCHTCHHRPTHTPSHPSFFKSANEVNVKLSKVKCNTFLRVS